MVSNGALGDGVDEVKPQWKVGLKVEPEAGTGKSRPCLMQNAPLRLFICPQIATCGLPCTQKNEQEGNQDFVFRERLRLHMKVERTMQEKGDARRD